MTTSSPSSAAATQFRRVPLSKVGKTRMVKAVIAFCWAVFLGLNSLMFLAVGVAEPHWIFLFFFAVFFAPAVATAKTSLLCLNRSATIAERTKVAEVNGWLHVVSITVGLTAIFWFTSRV